MITLFGGEVEDFASRPHPGSGALPATGAASWLMGRSRPAEATLNH